MKEQKKKIQLLLEEHFSQYGFKRKKLNNYIRIKDCLLYTSYNRIEFTYNTRDDVIDSYAAGNIISQKVLSIRP